jgi:hypothetical protein
MSVEVLNAYFSVETRGSSRRCAKQRSAVVGDGGAMLYVNGNFAF